MSNSKDEKVDGATIAARILRSMGPDAQARIMKAIAAKEPEVARKLEEKVYNFGKLAELEDTAVQTLLREVQYRDVVVSLKAADQEVRNRIIDNLSQTKQKLIAEDVSSLPPMKISDVRAAQLRIMRKLEELYSTGKVNEGSGGISA